MFQPEEPGLRNHVFMGKRLGNYIPLSTSSCNFFRNGVHAVFLQCRPAVR